MPENENTTKHKKIEILINQDEDQTPLDPSESSLLEESNEHEQEELPID